MVAVVYTPLPPGLRGRVGPVNDIFAAFADAIADFQDPALYNTGRETYGTESGVADAYVVTLPVAPASYQAGLTINFIPTVANTGAACTVNVNGLGVKSILDFDGVAPAAGMLPAGRVVTLRYNGTVFHIYAVAVTTTVSDGAVTNAKLADMAQARIKGRAAGAGTGDPVDLTPTQVAAVLAGEVLTVGAPVTASDALNETAANALYERQDNRLTFSRNPVASGQIFRFPYYALNEFTGTYTPPVSGTLYFVPIFFGRPTSIDALGYVVIAGGSGNSADRIRMGLYANDAGRPGALVHATVQAGALTTSGVKELELTTGATTVAAGWWWVGFTVAGTASTDFRVSYRLILVPGPENFTAQWVSTTTSTAWGLTALPSTAPAVTPWTTPNCGFDLVAVAP